jgi:uncharacterized protein
MKKLIVLFMAIMQINSYAQTKSASDVLLENGIGYINGIQKNYNPVLGKKLLDSSALLGNAKAMNALGNLYLKGIAVKKSIESSLYWYNRSIESGYSTACLNAGNIYRLGSGVSQNFIEAAKYYKKGIDLKDANCKNHMAYMYYKGLGVVQDYNKAFYLFKEAAEIGNENAMYFLGLCYRNGYGVAVNTDIAKRWLQKANKNYNRQALYELNEEIPENVSSINLYLQDQLVLIKSTKEKFIAANTNNYDGVYNGYAVYYDWSGKFVSEIQPLQLKLKKENDKYIGKWKEGNSQDTEIKLLANGNNFKFDEKCSYSRINHYSGRKEELWNFNNADIGLFFRNDSIQLSGYVQFYSNLRKEPGKPLQIFLKKSIENTNNNAGIIKFSIFPNPATTYTAVEFTITQASKITFRIYAQNGELLYSQAEKLLPSGKYTYNLPTEKLLAGTYNVQLLNNGKLSTTNVLVKQ